MREELTAAKAAVQQAQAELEAAKRRCGEWEKTAADMVASNEARAANERSQRAAAEERLAAFSAQVRRVEAL